MKEIFPLYSIGHFINQPKKTTEFEITFFDVMDEPEVDEVHKHRFYEIQWIDEGTSRQAIDFQSYTVEAKSLFFISPGQVHEFEQWQGLKGGTIMFTEDYLLQNQQNKDKLFEISFLDNVSFNPRLLLPCVHYATFRKYIDLLVAEKLQPVPNDDILQSLLNILLLEVQRSVEKDGNTISLRKQIVLFKRFKSLLEKNFMLSLTPAAYASELNITQHHLNKIVKEITSKTTTEVIRSRIILEAKRMISFTDYSISEVAVNLGFFDSSYFSRIFKSETGSSPMEFKSEMSERYRRRKVLL